MNMNDILDIVTPWFLRSGGLNVGEDEAIRLTRGAAVTIDSRANGASKVVDVSNQSKGLRDMNTPIKLTAKAVERLTPYLKRVQSTSKTHWDRFVKGLEAKGVKVTSVEDVIKHIRENPLSAAVVFLTLAEVGLAASDLFSSEDKADLDVRKTTNYLDSLMMGTGELAEAKIAEVAAASQTLQLGVADREVEIRTLQEICSWAKSHFGGVRAALDAHQKMQAFQEINYADLEAGFRLLR